MTEQREFYAANVEEAVAKAARTLGVEQGDLSYRVVDEGNSGFLGIGARDARIAVDAPAGDLGATEPEAPEPPAPRASAEGPALQEEGGLDGASEDRGAPLVADIALGAEVDEAAESVPQEVVEETEGRIVALLDAMGFDARVDVYEAGGYVAVDVAPDNTALFIGQKGETIDALQYLVNAGVNKSRDSRTRIVIDAEGYRQRRIEALQGMAHRTARKAMREDRAVELPPMNPAERRVVHLYLRDNPGVTTESEGTGDSRRVRVSPS